MPRQAMQAACKYITLMCATIAALVAACDFGKEQPDVGFSFPEEDRGGAIEVKFGDRFLVHWDCAKHRIIEDRNYFAALEALKDKRGIRYFAGFIADGEVVCDYVCSKNSVLKKGDIAYLLLVGYDKGKYVYYPPCKYYSDCNDEDDDEYDAKPALGCLIMPPWPMLQHLDFCEYPGHLLDYLEMHRDKISHSATSCLDGYGVDLFKISDTIRVEFGEQFALYWNYNNGEFVKDYNYYNILNSNDNLRSMASFITDEEIVCHSCSHNGEAIKKGYVAYMFLVYGRDEESDFDCSLKGVSFEDIYSYFSFFDYLDKNRDLAFRQAMHCLDGKKIYNMPEKPEYKSDIIKVEFGDKFVLHWNRIEQKIIEDENYHAISKNKNSIRALARFITDEEVVSEYVCNKSSAPLKKGDIAYIFLRRIGLVYPMTCFGIQVCTSPPLCGFDKDLLDYMESDRDGFLREVMSCLDKEGIPR